MMTDKKHTVSDYFHVLQFLDKLEAEFHEFKAGTLKRLDGNDAWFKRNDIIRRLEKLEKK